MVNIKLKYVNRFKDRYGNERYYFRRYGKAWSLPSDPESEEFAHQYHELLKEHGLTNALPPRHKSMAGSFEALVRLYYISPEFRRLKPSTQIEYRRYIEPLRKEHGWKPVNQMTRKFIIGVRDKHADRPRAADSYVEKLKILCRFAVNREFRTDNPSIDVKLLGGGGKTYEPWSADELYHFANNASPMHKLAFSLLLYTGQRRGDVVSMAWSHYVDGEIKVSQGKTGKRLFIPVHKELSNVLINTQRKHLMILHTSKGTAFGAVYFGNWFKKEMVRLGLQDMQLHGLRKNAVNALLEAGCSEAETSSISGQSLRMVMKYAEKVNQRSLARAAIGKWENNN